MKAKKVSIYEMFGQNTTPEGDAAVQRAMEIAAKKQADLLRRASEIGE